MRVGQKLVGAAVGVAVVGVSGVCPLEMPPSGNFIKLFALNSQIQFEMKKKAKINEQIVVAVVRLVLLLL